MKRMLLTLATLMLLVMVPAFAYAQTTQTSAAKPPISQPLVREGTVAVKLAEALQLGTTTDEAQAESLLSSAGIAPHNGWIADYPVTPDIASELRNSVATAAAAGSVKMGEDAALAAYDGAMDQYNLAFKEDPSGKSGDPQNYPDPTVINNYYQESPPVVTYYAPPAAYVGLYSWVPYPFWWWNFWFPGFFVLVDFHRPFFFGGHLFFVSNHFFDRDDFVRVNAFERFERFHHDFDWSHDRSLAAASRRVIGPSKARTGAETALRHNMSTNSMGGHRSTVMHDGRRTANVPSRSVAPTGRSDTHRTANDRGLDRSGSLSRQMDTMPRTAAQPPRSFGAPFGGGRSVAGFGGRSFGHRM